MALFELACGRELVQTARLTDDSNQPNCDAPVPILPSPPAWATGTVEASPLTSAVYDAGAGPGLWIRARDAYRLYHNGRLVAEASGPRALDFVPLSLLPGDNALSVVVWAKQGTPLVLLQLDELTRSYVSDGSWQVTRAPDEAFTSLEQDEAAWSPVHDYGRWGSLPGCDPDSLFPASSLARWIGPDAGEGESAVLRKVIRVAPIGFGGDATGGGSAEPVAVSTWEELEALANGSEEPRVILLPEGDYDFRRQGEEAKMRLVCPSVCDSDPEKLLYTVLTDEESCPVEQVPLSVNERRLSVGSNTTLVGLGRGARLRGVSLKLGDAHNVVVRNLALYDVNPGLIEAGDAVGMQGARDIWLDHVTTKWISDGMVDIDPGTASVTLSWLRADGVMPAACLGRHTHLSTIKDAVVTWHHSLLERADSHMPLVEGPEARLHFFDNLLQDNAGYGLSASCGAEILLEGTTFRNVATPTTRRACDGSLPAGSIWAPAASNLYLEDVGEHDGDGSEPRDSVFGPDYDYEVDAAETAWPEVERRAGAGGPWAQPLRLEP